MNDNELTLRRIAELASERHDGAKGRALGRIAEQRGLDLSYTTVDKILTGKYRSTPKPATLDALALLAGVEREDVYRAAGVPMPMAPFAEQLPPDADLLTPLQRDAVLAVVRQFTQVNKALYSAQEAGGGEDAQRSSSMNSDDSGTGAQVVELPKPRNTRKAARKTGRPGSTE